MIETRLLARLLATARTVTALGAVPATAEVGDERSEQVRAQVAARLSDGTFRVLVDGRALKLALPTDVKPGDVIELRVVNRAPGGQAAAAGADSEAGTLSSTGRFISALLSAAATAAPRQARPILELPPTAPAELPEPLARAVERSGMFYESHQARWADGDYPLERLLQEPQAELSPPGAKAAATADPGHPSTRPPAAALLDASGSAKDAASTNPQLQAAQPADEAQPQAIARELLPLVRSQLEALDTRQITWLGEIWPGQSMHWEIGADDSSPREDAREAGWSTRFSLELPALGEIGADMAFGAGGVRLNLEAHTAEAAALMRAAAPELAQALTAAGVAPVHLKVSRDEPAA